jgi:hypothetical protein
MSTVKDIDRGWNKIEREIRQMENAYVKVGYFAGGEKHTESVQTVAEVAVAMEYGVPESNVPARPFFSTSFDRNRNKYNSRIEKYTKAVLDGKMTTRRGMLLLGVEAGGDIKVNIKKGPWKPLKPSTVARRKKQSNVPLIDTGQMMRSVEFEVGGTNMPRDREKIG